MSERDGDVSVNALSLGPGFRHDGGVSPPDMTLANDISLVSFEAWERTGAHVMQACFRTSLSHGFSREDVAPLVFDKLTEIAAKKMHYTSISPSVDITDGAGKGLRREAATEIVGLYPAPLHGIVILDLAFRRDETLYACVDACTYRDACEAAVRAPRFSGALSDVPKPGLALSATLAAVHHPTQAGGLALALGVVLSVLAVTTRRRPRR